MTELFYIENEFLRAGISPLGAELRTLTDKSGNQEILKVEDDPDWDGCAPILFPICGRLWEQTTKINGTPYRMDIHGFASTSVFAVTEKAADRISLSISDTDEIRESTSPFRFTLTVS